MPKTKPAGVATPRAWRSATLMLGPVSVSIGLKTLSADEKIYAKTLCPCHSLPIKQATTCQVTDVVIEPIKRYEVGDTYVELDASELEAESDYMIDLTTAAKRIDPAYYGKPYLIWPKAGYEAQFDMVAAAVCETGKTLIGTVVLTKATEVFAVSWSEEFGTLLAHTLVYGENIATAEIALVREAADARPAPSREYVKLLTQLIDTKPDVYDADAYTNDYRDRLRAALAAAANGEPIPQVATATEAAPVVDLMAALTASIEAAKKPAAKSAAKKPAAKRAPRKKAAA